MKMKVIITMVTLFLVTLLVPPINIVPILADSQASTTVFVDPPTIKGTVIGENVTVNIGVSNITDLYGWQAGLTFNPDVLNCTGYYEGEFLKRKGLNTTWCNQTPPWDNTKGVVYYHGCCLLGAPSGVNGSGQLGYLTFEVIGTGVSDIHLTDVILIDSKVEEIQHEVVDIFTVSWGGVDYSVEIVSNLTGIWGESSSVLFDHNFSPQEKTVTFDVITHHDDFYEVTIPKGILKCDNLSEWAVTVDGSNVTFVPTESPTDTSLYFTYHNGTHEVEITGTVLGKPGDLYEDGKVNIKDIGIIGKAFGSKPGDDNWNPIADVYEDGKINIKDIGVVAKHFGATYP